VCVWWQGKYALRLLPNCMQLWQAPCEGCGEIADLARGKGRGQGQDTNASPQLASPARGATEGGR